MEPICSMLSCNRTSIVHFFPFPKNFEMCMLWVQSCRRADLMTDFMYEGAKAVINKFVCSEHFTASDFADPNCHSKGLNVSAIPIPSISSEQPFHEKNESSNLHVKTEIQYDADYHNIAEVNKEEHLDPEPQFEPIVVETAANTESFGPMGIFIKEEFFDENDANEQVKQTENHYQLFDPLNEIEDEQNRNRANALRNAIKRANETESERQERLHRNALRSAVKRSMETQEEKLERLRKNAERVAFKRKTESEDKKELRRLKDRIRSAERRKHETTEQTQYRRYIDAVRSAFRRHNETEEQRQQRRESDIVRAARRKLNETKEQRERRLQSDRERSARRRMLTKFADSIDQWCNLGKLKDNDNTSCANNIGDSNNFDCSNIKQEEDAFHRQAKDNLGNLISLGNFTNCKHKDICTIQYANNIDNNYAKCSNSECVFRAECTHNKNHSPKRLKNECEDNVGHLNNLTEHSNSEYEDASNSQYANNIENINRFIECSNSEYEDVYTD